MKALILGLEKFGYSELKRKKDDVTKISPLTPEKLIDQCPVRRHPQSAD